MKRKSLFSGFIFITMLIVELACARATFIPVNCSITPLIGGMFLVLALLIFSPIKIADRWGKLLVLSLGQIKSLTGRGLFFIISIVSTIPFRLMNTSFAEKFGEAAKTYANNPVALHLRAMNMLYDGLKQNSTIVIVPSSAVDTMQLGSMAGLTALIMGIGQEKANKENGTALQEN